MKTKFIFALLIAALLLPVLANAQEQDTVWTKDLWQLGSQINQVQFTPDGQNIAVAIGGGIYIFDKVTGEIIKSFKSISGSFVFSDDGKKLISSNHLNEITVWDYDKIDTLISFYNIGIQKIKLLDYNTLIGVSSNIEPDNKIYLYFLNLINGEVINKLEISDGEGIACSRENNILALINYVYGKRYIELWDITTLKRIVSLGYHTNSITDLRFSNDGKYLASASSDGIIKIWDVQEKRLLKELTHLSMKDGYLHVKFSPNAGYLVSSGGIKLDFHTIIWDLKNYNSIYKYTTPLGGGSGLAISLDSNLIVTALEYRLILLNSHWLPTEIKDPQIAVLKILYPNPANNSIIIPIEENKIPISVSIYSIAGDIVRDIHHLLLSDNNIEIDISKIKQGSYFIKVIYPKETITYKFEKIN